MIRRVVARQTALAKSALAWVSARLHRSRGAVPSPGCGDPLFQPTTDLRWPIGLHYLKAPPLFVDAPWVDLKLRAAYWYRGTLGEIYRSTGDLDRFAGVELAVDACLANMSSAFDAAVALLIDSLEAAHQPSQTIPEHLYGWRSAKDFAQRLGLTLPCAAVVDASLAGERTDDPQGWLAQVRKLRNRSTHRSTLNRHFGRSFSVGAVSASGQSPTEIRVPGRAQPVDPLSFFDECLPKLVELVRDVLADRAPSPP